MAMEKEEIKGLNEEYKNVIKKTYEEILKGHNKTILEDCNRYAEKLAKILKHKEKGKNREEQVKNVASAFNTSRAHLDKYITVGLGMTGTPTIILRFYGREVARIYFDSDTGEKSFEISKVGKTGPENVGEKADLRKLNEKFEKTFADNGLIVEKKYRWNLKEGTKFRRIFARKDANNILTIKKEHYFESQLLKDFSSKNKNMKTIPYLQPVKYAGCRLQFPTKIKGSKAKDNFLEYSRTGGGIDILARRKNGRESFLCIIELKDESKDDERPEMAIKQAIAYATFVDFILREQDSRRSKWFEIFGLNKQKYLDDNGNNKKPMTLFAIIAMPKGACSNEKNAEDLKNVFENEIELPEFEVDGKKIHDTLKLHYLYFDKDKVEKGKMDPKPITSLK